MDEKPVILGGYLNFENRTDHMTDLSLKLEITNQKTSPPNT